MRDPRSHAGTTPTAVAASQELRFSGATGRPLRLRVGGAAAGVLLLGGLLAACGSSASSSSSPPLQVGVAVGLTGYLSADDIPYADGVKLAASELNSHGGVDGHRIVLHVEDMQSSAAQGVTVMEQFINQDHIDVAIGGDTSAATDAYVPMIARAKIPLVANTSLPTNDEWTFSTYLAPSETTAVEFAFLRSKLHVKKIAVLYTETAYGEEVGKEVPAEAKKAGIDVVSNQGVPTDATDMTPELQTAAASGAQAILDFIEGSLHLVEAKSAANLGLKIPILMAQDATSVLEQASSIYPNSYWLALPDQVYPHIAIAGIKAANVTFQKLYDKTYPSAKSQISYAARGWDAMQIIAKAVRTSGALTGPSLRNALDHIKYTGANSEYVYTPADHTGQVGVPNPLEIGKFDGSAISIVYSLTS